MSSIKIATISASSRREKTRGGGWIVANRGSYSEMGDKRKVADAPAGLHARECSECSQ
jgi:hypothetical protein